MNRVGQQPQQRPPNLPQPPAMQFNRGGAPGYPAPPAYSNVPSRPSMPQTYPNMQSHRAQSIGPQPPGFSRAGSMGYFGGPTSILGPPIPSPNSALQSLQQQQNQVSIPQQQQQSSNNGLPPHLSSGSNIVGNNPSSNSSNTNASGSAVDESEFPPLSASSQQGGGAGSTSSSLAGGGNLHSSYASQAGTAIGSQTPSGLSTSNAPRDEDFPPLGAQQSASSNSSQGHDGHSNGFTSQQPQDQTQQHRANLIGSLHSGQSLLGQSLATGGQSQSRSIHGFPTEADKRQNFSKLNQNNHLPWSSQQQPTPTSSGFLNGALNQQQPHLGPPPNLGFPSQPPTQSFTPGPPGQSAQTPGILQLPHQQQLQLGISSDASSNSNGQSNNGGVQAILPQTPAQQILLSAADRWGLLGLLAAIKGTDPDSQLLTIGSDLSAMGLDMNTPGSLYSTFITPWSDSRAALSIEPEFHLPACYNVSAPAPGPAKAQSFSDETLFYMFYSSPRDTLQEVAAQELYSRNWRFHKEIKLWLTKETGQSPFQKGATFERGTYTFFDPDTWQRAKKDATIYYEQLEERVLPPSLGGMGLNMGALPMNANMASMQAQAAPPMGLQAQPLRG